MGEPPSRSGESASGPSRADRLRRRGQKSRSWAPAAVLVVLACLTAVLVGPSIHASGELREVGAQDLGTANSPARAEIRGSATEDENGYRVRPRGQATVTLPVTLVAPGDGRSLLRIWAYGPERVTTTVVLRTADGSRRTLGRADNWVGETFDVTADATAGTAARLEVTSHNTTTDSTLFFDRVGPVSAPASLSITASSWSVGLLVLLVSAALLAVASRLRRHWHLSVLLAGAVTLLWTDIPSKSLEPLSPTVAPTWEAARNASWSGFHDGLLWGSWKGLSSLAVQVFHAFTPIVGTAPGSARAASLLAAICALAAIYALGNRAAGRLGGIVAFGCAIAAAAFREAAVDGETVAVLVLAGALAGYALHASLAEATPLAIGLLACGVVLLTLADPVWLPGGLAMLLIAALVCGRPGERRRIAGIGLIAVVVLLTPHLASTARQSSGSLFANVSARAIEARNVEFLGSGHGSATPAEAARDPFAGEPVSLPGYLFGDHSISQVIGGTLSGGQESLAAFGKRGDSGLPGSLAFLLVVLGVIYVLVLPRLRLLMLLPPLVVAPSLFIAERADGNALAAGAALWPAMLACAGILAYAAMQLARPVIEPRLPQISSLRTRLRPLRRPAWTSAARAAGQRRRSRAGRRG
ncbi:MAG: hypothetical protein M3401_17935 [Actinomycetota bacterium]|nr:hypothetical protein [Actinomycetota bacterium]